MKKYLPSMLVALLLLSAVWATATEQTLLPIPPERPLQVQYQTYAKSPLRPKLKLLGVKVYRRLDGNIGVTAAVKNIGSVPCKRCWMELLVQLREGGGYFFQSQMVIVSDLRAPLKPGESRRATWRCRETKFNVTGWQYGFHSYVGPSDP